MSFAELLNKPVATSFGPRIISEQHDVTKINWVAGVIDPGEMIACGYLPQMRRMSGEADDAYLTRIMPLMLALPMEQQTRIMQAAISRASLDNSTERIALMVAGKSSWSKLGVHIESATDSKNAIVLAGLDWPVDKVTLYYRDANGNQREQSDAFALVRRDTGDVLGIVGSRYKPIQNAQGFEFLDGVMSEYGALYESAGALYGGKKVFMSVRLPNQDFAVNGTDEIQAYAMFFNPHDSSGVGLCFPTSIRPECANTTRIAIDRDGDKGMRLRHTGDIKSKIESAKQALGLSVKGFVKFKEHAEVLASTPLRAPFVRQYVNDTLDHTLEVSAVDVSKGPEMLADLLKPKDATERQKIVETFGKQIAKRDTFIDDILNRYESRTNGVNGMRGTAWAAFNAVTEFADHSKLGKESSNENLRLSRRFESSINGDGDELKQFAFQEALSYAKN